MGSMASGATGTVAKLVVAATTGADATGGAGGCVGGASIGGSAGKAASFTSTCPTDSSPLGGTNSYR